MSYQLSQSVKDTLIIANICSYFKEDNGIGMSEEFQKHAFDIFARERNTTESHVEGTDIFARERNTTESHVEGTSLGLAITKRLIDISSRN